MSKQLAYLAFLVALVSQFILSPAMAMPKFLQTIAHGSVVTTLETTPFKQQLITHTALSHLTQETDDCTTKAPSHLSQADCDPLCEMITTGDCAYHCVSAPGIIDQSQLILVSQNSIASLQTASWSLQTVELSTKNPPPITV